MEKLSEIVSELKEMNSSLADAPRSMPFDVPQGYFEELGGSVMADIRLAEAKTGMVNPMLVPEGYFGALPEQMLAKIKEQEQPAKPRTIGLFGSGQWAAAAAVAIIITLGSLMMFLPDRTTSAERELSSIPGVEINDYLQRRYDIDVKQIDPSAEVSNLKVDSKDIVAYLNETGWD